MRCNKCGNEFGTGEICQHCGADKVAALGDFPGYSVPGEQNHPTINAPSSYTPCIDSLSSIICWKCGEVIPAESKYCPVCQVQLFVVCPKCGHRYSAQYANCNECGTNREEFLQQQKEQEEEQERQRRHQEEALRQAERERRDREELQRRRQEEAQREAEIKEEEERRERRGRNWVLIIFFGLVIIWIIGSSSEWIPALFGK